MRLNLGVFEGRGTTTIVQAPDQTNDYTLVVEFDDNAFGAAAYYDVLVDYAFFDAVLHDIDGSTLTFLSADGTNPYAGGNTRIHGTVDVAMPGDPITELFLEVVEGQAVVARARPAPRLGALLNADVVELPASGPLFELPSSEAARLDASTGNISLRLTATTASGATAELELGSVPRLVRYTGSNRYSVRDDRDAPPLQTDQGGDDWIQPQLLPLLDRAVEISRNRVLLPSLRVNDIANMNGGTFVGHSTREGASHMQGRGVDLDFGGLPSAYDSHMGTPFPPIATACLLRPAECAQRIAFEASFADLVADILTDSRIGDRIEVIFVCNGRHPFFDARLRSQVTAANFRKVERDAGHCNHFHMSFLP